MYLTRFAMNRSRRGTRALLDSPYRIHAAVESSFPPGDHGRLLWRVDTEPRATLLYVMSSVRPDLTGLVEQAGWPTRESGWETRDYDAFLSNLAAGQRWAFRLTANPVHSVKLSPGATRGKVLPHVTVAQQGQWLMERAEKCGFNIDTQADGNPNFVVSQRRRLTFRKGDSANPIRLSTAQYDGVLAIDDPDALRQSLTGGIGRAKSLGCGLMTLAPIG